MPAVLFTDILEKGAARGLIPAKTKEARTWYRDQAKNTSVAPRTLLKGDRLRGTVIPGNMYMFFYDPKGKKTLPYYDRFPMIFPIDKTPDGFIGINLHYLPYVLRAKLMDALYDTVTNAKYDTSTKLGITYKILKGASKFRLFKPTIKRYLNSNVRSRFLYIEPKEWDIALFLPVERFQKASKETVWRESRRAV
jgi:hypothetical protein